MKRLLRIVSSFLVIVIVITGTSLVCNHSNSGMTELSIASFYKESSDTLDYTVVGSSAVQVGIFPALMWKQYQITGNTLAAVGCDSYIYLSMVKEVASKQKDAVIMIDMDGYTVDAPVETNFSTYDYYWMYGMPNNKNRSDLIDSSVKKQSDILELYLERYVKIFKFHNNINELRSYMNGTKIFLQSKVLKSTHCMKGSNSMAKKRQLDDSCFENMKVLNNDGKSLPIDEVYYNSLIDLLSWSKDNGVELLFVDMPKTYYDSDSFDRLNARIQKVNFCKSIIEKYGYKVLTYSDTNNTCGFDSSDFCDSVHLNQQGAEKYTKWIGEYLKINYEFDKKEQTVIDAWNESSENAFYEFNLK